MPTKIHAWSYEYCLISSHPGLVDPAQSEEIGRCLDQCGDQRGSGAMGVQGGIRDGERGRGREGERPRERNH